MAQILPRSGGAARCPRRKPRQQAGWGDVGTTGADRGSRGCMWTLAPALQGFRAWRAPETAGQQEATAERTGGYPAEASDYHESRAAPIVRQGRWTPIRGAFPCGRRATWWALECSGTWRIREPTARAARACGRRRHVSPAQPHWVGSAGDDDRHDPMGVLKSRSRVPISAGTVGNVRHSVRHLLPSYFVSRTTFNILAGA